MPRNPRIFSRIDELDEAEAQLDLRSYVDQAVGNLLREIYEYRGGQVRQKSAKQYVGPKQDHQPVLAG